MFLVSLQDRLDSRKPLKHCAREMSYPSIISSLLNILAMGIYFFNVVKGGAIPNPVTWLIWLTVGLINVSTYIFVLHGDVLSAVPLIVVVCGILATALYSLINGKFSKIAPADLLCFVFAIATGIFWKVSGDPVQANLWLQLVYVFSFVPTIRALHSGKCFESPGPWLIAVTAYLFMILDILLKWETSSWVALVHPIVNGLLGNGLVAYYGLRRKHS